MFYHDFFEPLPEASLSRTRTGPKRNFPDSSGQVRFHDEVKVLKIKARGKNLPISTMEDEDDEDDDEDDDDNTFIEQGNRLQR